MTNARLQLVFLGQLIEGSTDTAMRDPDVGTPIATDHQKELVLWHDLEPDEARRVASCVQRHAGEHDVEALAPPAKALATTQGKDMTPFPVLQDIVDEPMSLTPGSPQPVRKNQLANAHARGNPTAPHMRAENMQPHTLRPIPTRPATKGSGQAPEVRCPHCGTRQTMRVLCRGCASFLEIALKVRAERDAQARAKARSGGLLAMLGL